MKPVYKRVKMLMPHCPKCGEQLAGNNSIANPWVCECGIWVHIPFTCLVSSEYEIKNLEESNK